MQKIVLATTNQGKVAEIQELLADLSLVLIPQSEFNIPEIEETGTTFFENAIIKARHVSVLTGLPALADDSGLVVNSLNGAPGVYSARYAGPNASDSDLIEKLLTNMKDVEDQHRQASFHCVLVLMRNPQDPAPWLSHGIWDGLILHESRGQMGFGYDPVFFVPDYQCTAAELLPKEKNRMSHRGRAMIQLRKDLESQVEWLRAE